MAPFHQLKNRNRAPVDIEMPILPELQRIIDATPTGDLTWVVTSFGVPFSMVGFSNKMHERCDEVELPECSAHGLRTAGATIAAENGATCTSSCRSSVGSPRKGRRGTQKLHAARKWRPTRCR